MNHSFDSLPACGNPGSSIDQDREITLCPRTLQVLRAQIALRERLAFAGIISHKFVFFSTVAEPLETTYIPYNRWTEVLETPPVRFRKPYNAQHSYSAGDEPRAARRRDRPRTFATQSKNAARLGA